MKGFLCLKNPNPKSASNTNRPKFNKPLTLTVDSDSLIIHKMKSEKLMNPNEPKIHHKHQNNRKFLQNHRCSKNHFFQFLQISRSSNSLFTIVMKMQGEKHLSAQTILFLQKTPYLGNQAYHLN